MTDPLSIVALAAAVGGAAGKLVEKTWDAGETWLKQRFGTHQLEAQQRARENAADFVQQLATHLNALENQRLLGERQIASEESHPQFARLLERTLLNAAETEDSDKHDLLARLVANRLAVASETTVALASQIACDTIARCTRDQLCLLALVCFVDEVHVRDPLDEPGFGHWLDVFLRPFDDFEFQDIDARHLVALGAITYDPARERDLVVGLQLKNQNDEIDFVKLLELARVEMLKINWDMGMAGIRLTSVGSIVGGLVLDQLLGKRSEPPKWG